MKGDNLIGKLINMFSANNRMGLSPWVTAECAIKLVRDNDKKYAIGIDEITKLTVMAIKHCPADHHDFEWISNVSDKILPEEKHNA